jgi:hypothetical protein
MEKGIKRRIMPSSTSMGFKGSSVSLGVSGGLGNMKKMA